MKRQDIEQRTRELLQDIIESGGYDLWDVEYVKEGSEYYLRVYADKEGGIMIDDCVEISRALEEKLDVEDFIEDEYILEVSSPGLTRKLKKDSDYERSIGKLLHIKLFKAENGAKEHIGRLKAFDEGTLTLSLEDSVNQKNKSKNKSKKTATELDTESVTFKRDNISSARYEYEEKGI